jgi:hypothetical protein
MLIISSFWPRHIVKINFAAAVEVKLTAAPLLPSQFQLQLMTLIYICRLAAFCKPYLDPCETPHRDGDFMATLLHYAITIQ